MSLSDADNSMDPKHDDVHSVDLADRYDELLEFLLEFTHRQAQWDQRQSELVQFQRRSIDQLKHSSRKVIENHSILDEERRLIESQRRQLDRIEMQLKAKGAELDSVLDDESSTPRDFVSDVASSLAQLEIKQAEFDQLTQEHQRLVQKTRLQRKKLAQQLRAQRAEIHAGLHESQKEADPVQLDLSWLEDLRNELTAHRSNFSEQLEAMQQELAKLSETQRNQLQSWLDEFNQNAHDKSEDGNDEHEENNRFAEELQAKSHDLELRELDLKRKTDLFRKLERQTKLQRKKIAQQLRAQRAELESERLQLQLDSSDDVLDTVIQIKKDLLEQWNKVQRSISRLKTQEAPPSDGSAAPVANVDMEEIFEQLREELLDSLSKWQEQQVPAQQPESAPVNFDTQELINQIRHEVSELASQIELPQIEIPQPDSSSATIDPSLFADALNEFSGELDARFDELSRKIDEIEVTVPGAMMPSMASATDDREFARMQKELVELTDKLDAADRRYEELEKEATKLRESSKPTRASSTAALSDDVGELQTEIDRLTDQLEDSNKEIKVLKQKLERPIANSAAGSDLSWEDAKKKMLEELESFDGDDEEQEDERLKIEDVIKQTDKIIEQKNREIEELEHLLSHQSESIGGMAVGAAAIAEMLDQDELIQQERENLSRLQEEWKEKLSKAEVELSIERARIARERAELNERIAELEEAAGLAASEPAEPTEESPKGNDKGSSGRGKWLNRLGLRDQEE